jgi:peptidoglycan/xylan/chitin deacetylase (PgdA/CDA1 family)
MKNSGHFGLRSRFRRLVGWPKRTGQSLIARYLGAITRVRTEQRVAALTFDDGPDPEWTPRLLALLERHGAKATFFVVGEMAQRHPLLIERIARAGHALGNHSWNHPSFPCISKAERLSQIARCEQLLAGHSEKLFRPPFGDMDLSTMAMLRRRGYRAICWDAAGVDWERHDCEWILAMLWRQLRPGSIVLLHDQLFAYSSTDEPSRAHVFDALDQLLAQAPEFRFVTVPELLTHGQAQKTLWLKRSDASWLEGLESISDLGFKYGSTNRRDA